MTCFLLSLDTLIPTISQFVIETMMNYVSYRTRKLIAIMILCITLPYMPEPEPPYQERLKADKTLYGTSTKMLNDALTKLERWVNTWHVKRKYKRPPWAARRRFKLVDMTAPKWIKKRRFKKLMAMAMIMAMSGTTAISESECGPFDSDSNLIGIDNRCSGCITHVRTDIPGELRPCDRVIKGFGGTKITRVWQGTIHWSWDDDLGQTHKMVIPNAYYVPDGHIRLLSPQHWAQTRMKASDKKSGTGEETTRNM